ncbi:methionine ABC transporter permease [Frigoribacterium sp. PhB118]|uniref:methionine ABC transporter permease n=1 Tax=Frigoribacterium sp. PhB118 TaxID=2485175 RepID=UPI000F4A6544|nr:methionine ABC transporter permease [Frigoribacterium sp. PhB118]ROS57646.1 ABC-type methionine transport system permease subunit [Frigoribacterium sp. PhB118]
MSVVSTVAPITTTVLASGTSPSTAYDNSVPWAQIPALVLPALGDTFVMVGIVMAIVVLVGLPLGALVHNLGPAGLVPNAPVHTVLSAVISIGRSLPFLILMASIVPFTRFVTGTNIGIAAAVVPMSIAGIAFFTRIVENSLRSVPSDRVRVATASGASRLQIVRTAQLSEALPGLIGGLTINTIAMIEYSAIAGTIGAGGIGYVAVTYGYQRFDHTVMIVTIVLLVATVAAVQQLGDLAVRATSPEPVRRRRWWRRRATDLPPVAAAV